jgi:hypothetical protein
VTKSVNMRKHKTAKFKKSFSFSEMTSNTDGKTSGSGTAGIIIVFIGAISFITGVILIAIGMDDRDIMVQSIAIIYAGAALLGVRKMRHTTPYHEEYHEENYDEYGQQQRFPTSNTPG